jgi:hypothetical protein
MRLGGLLLVLAATPSAAQTLHYEGSAGLATGTYIFTERTSSWSLFTGLAFNAGPVSLRASLPVFYQSSALIVSTGTGYLPTGGSSSGAVADSSASRTGRGTTRRASVVRPSVVAVDEAFGDPVEIPLTGTSFRWAHGDPMLSASLSGLRLGRLGLILGVTAKVPIVDTADFGTGAWDVGASLSSSVLLGYHVLVGVDLAYWYLGDPPGLDVTNPFLFGGTVSYLANGGWGLAAGLSGATPTIPGFAPSVSVTASVLRPGRVGSVGLLATIGLTETAPDVSAAITWRVGLLH